MRERSGASWIVYALGALLIGAIVAAALLVGPAAGQQSTQTRVVTVQRGVVQSTVSGSGNVAAASQLDLGFKTSGTISAIEIRQGQRVVQGQLLATLDPQSAEVTLEQAKASLQSAEANLAREEETDGETSGQSASDATGASGSAASGSTASGATAHAAVATAPSTSTTATGSPAITSLPAGEAPATSTTGSTAPSTAAGKPPTTTKRKSRKSSTRGSSSRSQSSSTAVSGSAGSSTSASSPASGSSSSTTSISAATREANIASARAAVRSERLTVKGDEQAVADTRLLAPEDGTIVSLSGEVGETVSGGGTSRDSSGGESSSSGGSASAASAAGAGSASGSGSSSSGSAGTSASSSSSFAVLSDLSSMKLVVPLSESEVGSVKARQTATVTVEALKSAKLAAHVSEVAALSTSNSGVVSYDVTFVLDQLQSGLKAGMSATAEVVVAQAEGVNVPTSAISGGSVTVVRDGKQERRAVITGLAGDSSTQILSGLKAGERVVLPLASTSGSTSSLLSRLAGSGGAGAGALGGAAALGGGGFARGGAAGGFAGGGRPGG